MQSDDSTWEDLRVLLAVARDASFLGAGKALGLSTSTVARRVSALERHVGARLVRRSASGATLEPAASSLIELAEQIEARMAVAQRDLGAGPDALAGTVKVALGDGFVRFVARVAAAFRRDHPETLVELVVSANLADLARREADLALRTVKSTSAAIVNRKVGELAYGLYAGEPYLHRVSGARLGRDDFARHDFVIYQGFLERQPEVRWLRDRGAARFPFRANSTDGLVEGAVAGQGIAALPVLLADATPGLHRLHAAEDPPAKQVFLAMHRDLREVRRVRAVADAIVAEVVSASTRRR